MRAALERRRLVGLRALHRQRSFPFGLFGRGGLGDERCQLRLLPLGLLLRCRRGGSQAGQRLLGIGRAGGRGRGGLLPGGRLALRRFLPRFGSGYVALVPNDRLLRLPRHGGVGGRLAGAP